MKQFYFMESAERVWSEGFSDLWRRDSVREACSAQHAKYYASHDTGTGVSLSHSLGQNRSTVKTNQMLKRHQICLSVSIGNLDPQSPFPGHTRTYPGIVIVVWRTRAYHARSNKTTIVTGKIWREIIWRTRIEHSYCTCVWTTLLT